MTPYAMQDYSRSFDPDAFFAVAGIFLLFALVIAVVTSVFIVWLYYRIFEKAGFNGWYGLLSLIPSFGPLICIAILAFSEWPANEKIIVASAPAGSVPSVVPVTPVAPAENTVSEALKDTSSTEE